VIGRGVSTGVLAHGISTRVLAHRALAVAVPFLLLGLCLFGPTAAIADGPRDAASPRAVVEARRATLKKMGAALKAIVEQLKTETPDNARMASAAQFISSNAPQLTGWFPAGTGPDSGVDTDALPYIWKERSKFDSLAERLVSESKALTAALAATDLVAIKTQAKVVTEACATCHHSFRAD